jgi:hypothetical protein
MALGRKKLLSLALVTAVTAIGGGVACAQQVPESLRPLVEQSTGCPPLQRPFPDTNNLVFSLEQVGAKRILLIQGGVGPNDGKRLAAYMATVGPINEVWLHSPGGTAIEGVHIGRVLRNSRIPVRVPAGFGCISSCSIAFLGGIIRRVDPGGIYGVHMFYYKDSWRDIVGILQKDFRSTLTADEIKKLRDHGGNKAVSEEVETRRLFALQNYIHQREQANAKLAGDLARYAIEMGVSRDYLNDVMFAQHSIINLTPLQIFQHYKENRKNLIARGYAESDADSIVLTAMGNELKTYACPSARIMRDYNIVNVQ